MPPLTINTVEWPVARGGWEEDNDYPAEEASSGYGRTIRSGVTSHRPHVRVISFRSAMLDRADALTLEGVLAGGMVSLGGWLPRGSVEALADEVQRIEDDEVVLYAQVACRLHIDTPPPV